MRLIDADTLIQKKRKGTIGNISGDFVAGFDIDTSPTIDAVTVVRCRECKYWRRYTRQWENHCAGECERHRMEGGTYENDFCSYGQRKEADHEVSE